MNTPLVSVVMPVLNGQKYVRAAIDSILQQSYSNFEFIILNDASTDNTLNILQRYNDSRIRIINFNESKGLHQLLNIGVSEAKGIYIMRMDADDISLKHRMQRQVEFLEKNSAVNICSSWIRNFTDNQTFGISKGYSSDDFLKLELLYRPGFAHPSVMYRKNIFDGGIRYRVFHSDDYDLWTQLSFENNFYKIPELLLMYRIHTSQFTNVHVKKNRDALFQVQLEFLQRNGIILPDNYLKVHQALTFYDYTFTISFLMRVAIYFRELQCQLNQSGRYKSENVQTYIDDQFYFICSHFVKNGINSIGIFLNERRSFKIKRILILIAKVIYLLQPNPLKPQK